jgi:hypothetical protein
MKNGINPPKTDVNKDIFLSSPKYPNINIAAFNKTMDKYVFRFSLIMLVNDGISVAPLSLNLK